MANDTVKANEPAKATDPVKIAGDAVDTGGQDISVPVKQLLRDLNLLPQADALKDADGFKSAFSGPPDSVAVIEAGATAASKWWASAIGLSGAAVTARIVTIWDNLGGEWVKAFALLSVGIVLAGTVVAIAYLLASDLRGRAAAMVATIEARRDIAIAIAERSAAASTGKAPAAATAPTAHALPGLAAENLRKGGAEESGWKAIMARDTDGAMSYLLVKGDKSEWVEAASVKFV